MAGNIIVDGCEFAALNQVKIEAVNAHGVTFATRSDSATGDPDEQLRRVFTVPMSEILVTPIAGAPPPVAMVPGAIGTLFLSRAGWRTRSVDGFGIHGAEWAVFKWPICGSSAGRDLTRLGVLPSSIVVRGHLRDDETLYEVELLGADALPEQSIAWNGADHIVVRLSSQGARRLRVPTRSTTAELWPTKLIVTGSPAFDTSVSGQVDLLNGNLAGDTQQFSLCSTRAPILLNLTQRGVNAFHVTPEIVHATSRATVACQVCLGRDAEATRRRPRV